MTTPTRTRSRVFRRIGLAIVLLVVGGVFWWFCLRSEYSIPGLRVSYESSGMPNAVTFQVVDVQGRPISHVFVNCQSRKGWSTSLYMTDDFGRAIIIPDSTDVWAVRVGDHEILFRHGSMNREWFSPSCAGGLTVKVQVGTD